MKKGKEDIRTNDNVQSPSTSQGSRAQQQLGSWGPPLSRLSKLSDLLPGM